jgi:hypothetical protein
LIGYSLAKRQCKNGLMPGRSFEVAIDANDPERLRRFWATALSYVEHTTPEGAVDLVDPEGRGPTIWFQQVPEIKTAKNRLHLDVKVSRSQRDVLVAELSSVGGTVVRTFPGFTVLADPEGNELCLTDDQQQSEPAAHRDSSPDQAEDHP